MPRGKAPKYCYAREDSPFWWYRFKILGFPKTFTGSTNCSESKAAACFVELKRVEARKTVDAQIQGLGQIRNGRRQISLQQALDRFERDKGHGTNGWKSLRDKQRYAEYLLNLGGGGNMLLSEITEEDVILYRQRRKRQPTPTGGEISDATLNREVSHLQACMNYCGKTLKYEIPLMDWKLCKDSNADRERQWVLSPSEEARLFAEVQRERPDLVPLVQFAIWSAARKAAVVNMRWQDVNLEERIAIIYLKSQGRAKEHLIPLTDRMAKLLDGLPRVEGCDHVFTYECKQTMRDHNGGKKLKGKRYRFSEAGWTKVWNRAKIAAGLDGFRFHDLRHTGATRLTRTTHDIQLTKEQLGHADIKTTLRYSKVDVNDRRRGLELAQAGERSAANDEESEKVLRQSATLGNSGE